MRAARLLSILMHLQVHRRVTAGELAAQLEVSERTIYRDMEALSAAGIPVAAERGVGGGWYLLDEYRTDLTGLNESEVQTLFLTSSAQHLVDLGIVQDSEAALLKLLAALPARQRRSAELVRERIHIDGAGWHRTSEATPWLSALQEAIWAERKIELTYGRGDGETVVRVVDPLGLVAKGTVWYLVAGVDDSIRTYRISRVQHVRLTDLPCVRPEGFDLAEQWEQSVSRFLATLPSYRATLRIRSELVEWVRSIWRYATIETAEPAGEGGWQTIRVRFETIKEACAYVLGCGADVEVIEPEELRQAVAAQVTEMARLAIVD